MYLSDIDLKKALDEGAIKITPTPTYGETIKGCAIDLRIGNKFRRFKPVDQFPARISLDRDETNIQQQIEEVFDEEITLEDHEFFTLKHGEVILAHTDETIEIDDKHVGIIEGKSTIARLGVEVHLTANRINPGWKGQIVLEIANNGPVTLQIQPKAMFSAISFIPLSSKCEFPYNKTNNRYQGQVGATTPK